MEAEEKTDKKREVDANDIQEEVKAELDKAVGFFGAKFKI